MVETLWSMTGLQAGRVPNVARQSRMGVSVVHVGATGEILEETEASAAAAEAVQTTWVPVVAVATQEDLVVAPHLSTPEVVEVVPT